MSTKDFVIVIENISGILRNKFSDFRGIYFYGSRVRGNSNLFSDYDIAAVFGREINWEFENEILNIVYDFLVDNDIIIDCKVFSEKEILNPATPLKQSVKNEGIFYGA